MFSTTQLFRANRRTTATGAVFGVLDRIFHGAVRSVRKRHRNAVVGMVLSIIQIALVVIVFLLMFQLFSGLRAVAIRGDLILYLMSGVFLYFVHIKTVRAVSQAEGATSSMMLHRPLTTAISVASAALGTLYTQILAMGVVLFVYHAAFNPITIEAPAAAVGMLLGAWLFGVAIGMVLLAARPWWPDGVQIAESIWNRANMIASGKMFAANTLGYWTLSLFDWNPLFHLIDQCRGFTFINYNPHYTSMAYPFWVILALLAIAMMLDFYTRRKASRSWVAGR